MSAQRPKCTPHRRLSVPCHAETQRTPADTKKQETTTTNKQTTARANKSKQNQPRSQVSWRYRWGGECEEDSHSKKTKPKPKQIKPKQDDDDDDDDDATAATAAAATRTYTLDNTVAEDLLWCRARSMALTIASRPKEEVFAAARAVCLFAYLECSLNPAPRPHSALNHTGLLTLPSGTFDWLTSLKYL